MKLLKSTSFTLCALLWLASGFLPVEAKSYTDIKIPAIKWDPPSYSEFKLDNGMSGFAIEDHEVPIVNFYILFPAPFDPADKVGLGDLASWALRNGGTTNISPDSLNSVIEFKAGYLGISASNEAASVWGNCLSQDLPLFLELTRELIMNPAYPADKIALRKSTLIEGIRRKNDEPQRIARRELMKLLYGDHPEGRETTVETVNAITRDDMIAYHKLVFRATGAVIGYSGDLNRQQAEDLTRKNFAALSTEPKTLPPLPPLGPAPKPGVYFIPKETNQAFISMGHRSIRYEDPRRISSEIMNYVLGGGGFQSILMTKIRVDAGLTYGISSALSTPHNVDGTFRCGASTRLDQSGRTISMMTSIVEEFGKAGPTATQFEEARTGFVNKFVWAFESSDDVLGQVVYYKWRGLPLDTPQRDLAAYQALTHEDAIKAANELIRPEDLIIVVVGNREKMDRPLEDFGPVTTIDLEVH
jgi:predicted Zn-dependent peptidase